MASKSALLITDGLSFGGTTFGEEGRQILLPLISEIGWKAAPRKGKSKSPTMTLTIPIPADACPATDDISWLQFFRPDGKGGKLLDIKVIMEFEPDTLKAS